MIAQQRGAELPRARLAGVARAGQPNPRHPKKKHLWGDAVSADLASGEGAAAGRGSWRCWMAVAAILVGAGWGSNQFTPMLLVYRRALGLGAGSLEAMFGVYALGLIPGLLIAGPLADARGRRLPVLGAGATSLLASLLLIAGSRSPALLYLARFVVGLGSGAAFSAGTAWLRELSLLPPGNANSGEGCCSAWEAGATSLPQRRPGFLGSPKDHCSDAKTFSSRR
jgi:hypothetical protein